MTTELTKTGKVTSAVLAGVLGLGMVPAVGLVAANTDVAEAYVSSTTAVTDYASVSSIAATMANNTNNGNVSLAVTFDETPAYTAFDYVMEFTATINSANTMTGTSKAEETYRVVLDESAAAGNVLTAKVGTTQSSGSANKTPFSTDNKVILFGATASNCQTVYKENKGTWTAVSAAGEKLKIGKQIQGATFTGMTVYAVPASSAAADVVNAPNQNPLACTTLVSNADSAILKSGTNSDTVSSIGTVTIINDQTSTVQNQQGNYLYLGSQNQAINYASYFAEATNPNQQLSLYWGDSERIMEAVERM